MPPPPQTVTAETDSREQPRAVRTPELSAVRSGRRHCRALLPSRAAGSAQPSLPAAIFDTAGATIRRVRQRRSARPLRWLARAGGSYRDRLFVKPDLVEDDYYRFRNQPRG